MTAAQLDGRSVATIEGVAGPHGPHPIQKTFVEKAAVQCGFCTPGMVLAAVALLTRHPHPTRAQIRRGLAGNLCRCTGYQKIVDAVAAASVDLEKEVS
jgi:carbon-monoxide dehydrogenase small subunit